MVLVVPRADLIGGSPDDNVGYEARWRGWGIDGLGRSRSGVLRGIGYLLLSSVFVVVVRGCIVPSHRAPDGPVHVHWMTSYLDKMDLIH